MILEEKRKINHIFRKKVINMKNFKDIIFSRIKIKMMMIYDKHKFI